MKAKYINYWLICFVLFSLLSCNSDDTEELFSESPAERIAKKDSELLSLLLKESQGYKGVYFTKNDEFGGFTYFMNFKADGTVTMTSDFDSETDIISSSYDVRLGTVASELVFTTRNHIQKVSETTGALPAGFRGTSVFQYFGNENGVITFKDVRNRDTGFLKLTPTDFSDFETESVASVEKSLENRQGFTSEEVVTIFPFLTIDNGGDVQEYNLNFNSNLGFANPRTQSSDGSISDLEFGIAFTEDGLIVSPAIEFEGVLIENFTFDDTSGYEYVANVDGVTAKIGYSDTAVGPVDTYLFGTSGSAAVFNLDEMSKHSDAFNAFYQDFSNTIINDPILPGLQITNVIFWELNTNAVPYLQVRTNYGNVSYDIDFIYDETTGIVKFSLTGATNSPAFFTAIIQPLLDAFLGEASGYYVLNSSNYLNFPNRTFNLVRVDDITFSTNFWTF